MAKPDEHPGGPPADGKFDLVVNGEPKTSRDANVTYEEAVEYAYPGGLSNPDHMFKVDFENAVSQPHDGSLVAGGATQIRRDGTEFSVIRSVRS